MKTITASRLARKTFTMVPAMPDKWKRSLGELEDNFSAIVWGLSGQGKSNFVYQLVNMLAERYNTLYVSLEEGHGLTVQHLVNRYDMQALGNKVRWADHTTTFESLCEHLKKRKSAKVIVIDSVQYLRFTYDDYKLLKLRFPSKIFVFISHAKGKLPDGKTADKIRYDVGCKIRVEGYVAYVVSRYGGNYPFVIWEEGARKYYGLKQYKKIANAQ